MLDNKTKHAVYSKMLEVYNDQICSSKYLIGLCGVLNITITKHFPELIDQFKDDEPGWYQKAVTDFYRNEFTELYNYKPTNDVDNIYYPYWFEIGDTASRISALKICIKKTNQ
jgi:hypothetical protein